MKLILKIVILSFVISSFQEESLKWDYDKRGWSKLMTSIYYHEEIEYTMLINKNKDINYISKCKTSPWKLNAMDVAIRRNDDNAVELLIKSKKFPYLDHYLFIASSLENPKTVSVLLDNGADVNYIYGNAKFTPLINATTNGDINVIEILLNRFPKIVNYQNKAGVSSLMYACGQLDYHKVELLLEHNANKDLTDYKGKSASDYIDDSYEKVQNKEDLKIKIKKMLNQN